MKDGRSPGQGAIFVPNGSRRRAERDTIVSLDEPAMTSAASSGAGEGANTDVAHLREFGDQRWYASAAGDDGDTQ
jgi:hypothetical protein